jgi:Lar family restriction alleviation protein
MHRTYNRKISKKDQDGWLLPCPFCGAERLHTSENANGWHIGCDGCDARAGATPTQAQAVQAWNRRHSSATTSRDKN